MVRAVAFVRRPATTGTPSELELVARLRAGDTRAFATLVETHHDLLLRLARGYVRSEAVAEEVVQETWLAVIEGIDRFEGRSSLRTWMSRILVNRARTRGVREARSVPISALGAPDDGGEIDAARFDAAGRWLEAPTPWSDAATPERLLADAQTRAIIERAIAELPETQRLVMTMRDLADMDAEEVCATLDISEGNQRVLLHRARTRIRAELERHLGKRG